MNRLLPLLLGALLALSLWLASVPDPHQPQASFLPAAQAEDPMHPDEASCLHCHQDPHGEQAADECGSCHTPVAWTPTHFDGVRHAETAFPLHGQHAEVACASCHSKGRLKGLPSDCAGCHVDRHRGLLGEDCTQCHSEAGFTPVATFDHATATAFSLQGPHAQVACASCHEGEHGRALRQVRGAECSVCHTPEHGSFAKACTDCHTETHTSFASADFQHAATGFALERRHQIQPCSSCHPAGGHKPIPRCQSCHVDPHAGQLGARCDDCHRPDRWRLARFDHALTAWPLRGRHFVIGCAECHTSQRWIGLTSTCWDCHALDAAAAPKWVEAHRFGRSDCSDCHNQWRF